MTAADAIELQIIRPANDLEQDPVALGRFGGKILPAEINAA
jgi:hypothetical protein